MLASIALPAPGPHGTPPLLVPVGLTVNRVTGLYIVPTAIAFTQAQGASSPSAQTIYVEDQDLLIVAAASISLSLNVSSSCADWLSVSPTSGMTPASIALSLANAGSMAQGAYSGFVNLAVVNSNGASAAPLYSLPVTLNVVQPYDITVSPPALNFTATTTGTTIVNPPSQTISVSTTLAGIPFTVNADSDDRLPWLRVTPDKGVTTLYPAPFT